MQTYQHDVVDIYIDGEPRRFSSGTQALMLRAAFKPDREGPALYSLRLEIFVDAGSGAYHRLAKQLRNLAGEINLRHRIAPTWKPLALTGRKPEFFTCVCAHHVGHISARFANAVPGTGVTFDFRDGQRRRLGDVTLFMHELNKRPQVAAENCRSMLISLADQLEQAAEALDAQQTPEAARCD